MLYFLQNYRTLKARERALQALGRVSEYTEIVKKTEAFEYALDVLGDDERAIICGVYMDGQKIPDVARELFISDGHAYYLRRSAVAKLVDVLGPDFGSLMGYPERSEVV